MTRALPRTNFNSSKLVRVLADLALIDAAESGSAFAEKLGLWVGFTDAITLRAAHEAELVNPPSTPSELTFVECEPIVKEFTRVRNSLTQAITQGHSASGAKSRISLPAPKTGASFEDAIAYEPYRRYHLAHQRDIELNIRPLRTKMREVLAKASPVLKQLANLDAAFDGILSERESKVLSSLPSLLEKRFRQLLKTHQMAHIDDPDADTPDEWTKSGGWLSLFSGELQAVLLAELDIRLQPTLGLMEALNNEIKNSYE